jgi:hypothetical protein
MISRTGFISICLLIFSQLASLNLYAQGEIDDDTKIIFRNERSLGVNLNTRGYGASFRYGKFQSVSRKMLIEGGLNYIKHPKEISITYLNQSKPFVYGKVNSVYNFHIEYGYQKEIFSKYDKEGIAVRYYITLGPNFGFLKPKLYEVTYPSGERTTEGFVEFLENNMINSHGGGGTITGNAAYFDGIGDTRIVPGLHLTLGLNFDYGTSDDLYNAFDVGIMIDVFMEKMNIMHSDEGRAEQFFVTAFLSYRIGRILDAY